MAKKKEDKSVGEVIGETIFKAAKPIYKEGERQRRAPKQAARTPRPTFFKPEPKASMKDIVFRVMKRAISNAGANPSIRDLYYATRPLAYAHYDWPEDKTLEYTYFANTLVVEYERRRGSIEG